MKEKQKQKHRDMLKGDKGLSRKLFDYSIAAGAALAVAQPASAAVQYSGIQNITVSNNVVNVDLNGDTQNDFAFVNTSTSSSFYSLFRTNYTYNSIRPLNNNAVIFTQTTTSGYTAYTFPVARLMNASQYAGPAGPWNYTTYNTLGARYYGYVEGYSSSTQWGKFIGNTGYIGVRFHIGTNIHYGWIRASVAADCSSTAIVDWAYEDQPNTPIHLAVPMDTATVPTLNEWGILILAGLILLEGTRRMKRNRPEEQ